ncbi:MAG: lipase family protein [Candidatus Helarchaeota archaeon]
MFEKKYWKFYQKAFIKNEIGIENLVINNDEIKVFKQVNNLIIVFKGSNDKNDIKDNIRFWKKNDTHSGFSKIVDFIEYTIINVIKKYTPKRVTLIGYSKGGAIALEMGDRIASNDYSTSIYTYGQPAIWTQKKINQTKIKNKFKYYRIFFKRDLVVNCLNFIYKHYQQNEIKLPSKWWHWIPFMGIRVHQSYNKYYNKYYNK